MPDLPPRAAERLVRWLVGGRDADAVAGDLRESFTARGGGRAWYWGQALSCAAVRLSPSRRMMPGLGQDFHYALRTLRRNPGYALTAMVCLALAMGVNATLFSFLDSVYFRRLPVPDADRIVQVMRRGAVFCTWPQFQSLHNNFRTLQAATQLVAAADAELGRVSFKRHHRDRFLQLRTGSPPRNHHRQLVHARRRYSRRRSARGDQQSPLEAAPERQPGCHRQASSHVRPHVPHRRSRPAGVPRRAASGLGGPLDSRVHGALFRQSLARESGRPPRARRHIRTGARGIAGGGRAAGSRPPGARLPGQGLPVAQREQSLHARHRPDECGVRHGPADRLRQCRQPFAFPRRRAAARVGIATVAGRQPRASVPRDAGGSPAAVSRRCHLGPDCRDTGPAARWRSRCPLCRWRCTRVCASPSIGAWLCCWALPESPAPFSSACLRHSPPDAPASTRH